MNVLIDTSVWANHFRAQNEELARLVLSDYALMHPLVLGELACGTPPAPRQKTLHDLNVLRSAEVATTQEVIGFIEREQLFGFGCGLVDLSLLCATLITPSTVLWTHDRRLASLAHRFGVLYQPVH